MAYKLIIAEHADELLDNLVYHLLYHFKNEQAAKHLLDKIENIYGRLEDNPLQFPLCKENIVIGRLYYDQDSPEPSPAMYKAFKSSVIQRNRKKNA